MGYPSVLQALINQFAKFPGIGEKSAQRFVFFLLRQQKEDLLSLAKLIAYLRETIVTCSICHNYSDKNPCTLCMSQERDRAILCVVAYSHDVHALEKTGEYKGLYHVLGGNLNVLDGMTPDKLHIKQLVERIRDSKLAVREVILAFNPDLEGESTNLYLSKILKQFTVKTTKLARGLPRGADIEYADEMTLADAMKARREIH